MKKYIIEQSFLCALTYLDSSSIISPSLSQRVHVIFKEIYMILEKSIGMHSFREKVIAIINEPKSRNLKDSLVAEINKSLSSYDIETLNYYLHYLGEFGRILPHQGIMYHTLPKVNDVDEQVKILEEKIRPLKSCKCEKDISEVSIILCFKIDGQERLRNLYAAIYCIYLQNYGRENINIIAVNQDSEDKYKDEISEYVDHYIFAPNDNAYNYAWARNIGAMQAKDSSYFIFWDVDIITSSNFISKINKIFSDISIKCVLPYSSVFNLDKRSTSYIINTLSLSNIDTQIEKLSAQVMCEIYGGIIAVRSDTYFEVGGQNENFEGWGDEDNDFYFRIYSKHKVRRINGNIYHLDHLRPTMRIEGEKINKKHIGSLYTNSKAIGEVTRYCTVS